MANISISSDGTKWQVTNLAYDVVLISDPGLIDEKTPIRFDGRLPLNYTDAKEKLNSINNLDANQKMEIMFWFGYFYGYLVKA